MRDRFVGVADCRCAIFLMHSCAYEEDFVTPSGETVCERVVRLKRKCVRKEGMALAAPSGMTVYMCGIAFNTRS